MKKLHMKDVDNETMYMCTKCESIVLGERLEPFVQLAGGVVIYAKCPVCGGVGNLVWDESEDPNELGL